MKINQIDASVRDSECPPHEGHCVRACMHDEAHCSDTTRQAPFFLPSPPLFLSSSLILFFLLLPPGVTRRKLEESLARVGPRREARAVSANDGVLSDTHTHTHACGHTPGDIHTDMEIQTHTGHEERVRANDGLLSVR